MKPRSLVVLLTLLVPSALWARVPLPGDEESTAGLSVLQRKQPIPTRTEPSRPTPGRSDAEIIPRTDPTRTIQPFTLTLHALNTHETLEALPVFYTRAGNPGRIFTYESARRKLERFTRDPRTEKVKQGMPEELWYYLYLISYHFDRPIEMISFYRRTDRRTSRHRQGKAIDFSIPGVPIRDVYRYARARLGDRGVGIGLYPRSGFIHLDIRDHSYFWIDDSGPGQRPRYRRNVPQQEPGWRKAAHRPRPQGARPPATPATLPGNP